MSPTTTFGILAGVNWKLVTLTINVVALEQRHVNENKRAIVKFFIPLFLMVN
jgi:hypothetical protein